MRKILLTVLVTFLSVSGMWSAAHAQKPIVRAVLFYSQTCPNCHFVLQNTLPPLQQKYGSQLDIRLLEVNEPANYELWISAVENFRIPDDSYIVPMLFIGDQVLLGADEVDGRLPGLIEKHLATGGIELPKIPGLNSQSSTAPAPTITPIKPTSTAAPTVVLLIAPTFAPSPTATRAPTILSDSRRTPTIAPTAKPAPIHIAYFYQTGCQECSRAQLDIQYIQNRYPQVIVDEFNIYDHTPLAQWLADQIGRASFETPGVFIGQDALLGAQEFTPQNLRALVEKYLATGTERVWAKYDSSAAQNELVARFRSFGVLTVALAGLIDGLNPCAFAALIFFVSYLTLSGRQGKAVLFVGSAFTLGVFLTYLAVGLGLYKTLDLMGGWLTTVGRWVYALTALLCAILAAISFVDFLKARRGHAETMTLKLPGVLRGQVYAVVQSSGGAPIYILGVFVTGALISLIELACTGQIYLPTIVFVMSIPELRPQAIIYLVLYNLLFIAPLIVVFLLVYGGTTVLQLGDFLRKNIARVKLAIAGVFALLAIWLTFTLFR